MQADLIALKRKTMDSVVAIANAVKEAADTAQKLKNEATSAQVRTPSVSNCALAL